MKTRFNFFDFLNISILLLFSLIIILPLMHVLAVSLSDRLPVMQGAVSLFPKGFSLKSYGLMLSSSLIPRAFANTVLYTVTGTLINVLFTAFSAYPLSKQYLFARKFWVKLIIVTMFVSGGLIPNYLLVMQLGMLDTIWAIIIPGALSPFYLFVAISFFQSIPEEIEESAKIDGASVYRILFSIVFPLSKPVLASLTLFYSMINYNSYFAPLLYLSDREKQPLTVILQSMVIANKSAMMEGVGPVMLAEYSQQSLKYAAIFISIIPMLFLFAFMQKWFVKGVMVGALKG